MHEKAISYSNDHLQIEELLQSKFRNSRRLPLLISPGSEKEWPMH
jgi:hypothetical protein